MSAGAVTYAVHRRTLSAEWGHCDPAGIIFNPRFYEYFDWGTALLIEAATGLSKRALGPAYGFAGMPLVESQSRYLRAVRFGDTMQLEARIAGLGRSSFEVLHTIHVDAQLCVECRQKRVWCVADPQNPAALKSAPIPEPVARALRGGDAPAA